MLQAILKGKIRGLFDKIQDGMPWKKAYSSYEDFLTASVVSRMTYLPGDILWRVVKYSSLYDQLRKYAGGLEFVEFWPNWPMPDRMKEIGMHRQPDVFLKFEELDVIVEAKRNDFLSQSHVQWGEQLLCYLAKRNSEGEKKQPIVLWVLGGMGSLTDEQTLTSIFHKVTKRINEEYPDEEIEFAVSPWGNILYCLLDLQHYLMEEQRKHFPLITFHDRRHILRLVDDIIEALRLHGIKEWHFLSETAAYCESLTFNNDSLDSFNIPISETSCHVGENCKQVDWSSLNLLSCDFGNGLNWYGGLNE
jgi:hypothetical protein